jgi:hypothetical protein
MYGNNICADQQPYISTPMDNQNLPLELLRPIIEHLNDDLPSLLAVSLVSSALRVEGQRLLFRTVALSENVEAHIKFLSAVTSSTLLGHFVKEYHQVDLLDAEHKQEPLWGLTCHGLQAMVNLKFFSFVRCMAVLPPKF